MTRTGILETDEEIKRAKLAAGNCPEHAISVLDTAADETATDEGAAG